MNICKICNKKYKNNLSFSKHLKLEHNLSYLEYNIKYEGFIRPICPICGKPTKLKSGLSFRKTCDSKKCKRKWRSTTIKNIFIENPNLRKNLKNKRLEYMKNNPEKTAWRLCEKNCSYPEKIFWDFLKKENFDFVREFPVFPYFIDFALLQYKIAIEIDGSQHWKNKERIKSDKKKNKKLIEDGWRIFRIKYDFVIKDIDFCIKRLKKFIEKNENLEFCY